MNQNHSSAFNTRRVARCALVAAVYVALCLGLAPFSFGAVQIRVAEILTLMPIFGPEYIAAVSVGCFLSNLLPPGPPVVFNALIVGPEIAFFFSDSPATVPLVAWNAFTVGVGEVISCMVLGVLFVKLIESTPALNKLVRA